MGDMLSQAEIDALLNGVDLDEEPQEAPPAKSAAIPSLLTAEERDALGEIGNISMGTSATTLYALLGQKVSITTPRVEETNWDEISKLFTKPYVAVRVQYTDGLKGANLLVVREEDVKIITDLMMGGDGYGNITGELNELHLSAISEAMNQMIGSASTSLSSMFDKRVDISPPESTLVDSTSDIDRIKIDRDSVIVKISFSLKVGNLIDSEIMQLIPVGFAKEMVANLLKASQAQSHTVDTSRAPVSQSAPHPAPSAPLYQEPMHQGMPQMPPQMNQQMPQYNQQPMYQQMPQMPQMPPQMPYYGQPEYGYNQNPNPYMQPQQPMQQPVQPNSPVHVQPAQFQNFDNGASDYERKNIGLLMDVPLQIAVELGRTNKKIREILEFGQGSIIELDKLAGEPVDILVNGKIIAKGEVVVIDESFGVRITDIIHPSKRL